MEILCVALLAVGIGASKPHAGRACKLAKTVITEANKNNIDSAILFSLIHFESNFRSYVVSHAGACGLTQVIPKYTGRVATKRKYTCKQLKNPKTSIAAGAKILSWWLKNYAKGDYRIALCGYSSGFRCKGKKIIRGGMRYARKVMILADKFRAKKRKLKLINDIGDR